MLPLSAHTSPVITAPNPILRSATREVTTFDASLLHLAERMTSIMDAFGGIGLAAPQVGSLLDFAIIRLDEERVLPLANARISQSSGTSLALEGCLSLPGLSVPVERAQTVHIKAQDLAGEAMEIELEEMAARIAQHELDHLHGRLILDSFWSRQNPERGYSLVQTVL